LLPGIAIYLSGGEEFLIICLYGALSDDGVAREMMRQVHADPDKSWQ